MKQSNWYTPDGAVLQYRPTGVVRAVEKFTPPPFQHFTEQSSAEIKCTRDSLCPLCAAGYPAQAKKAEESIYLHVWIRQRLAWVDGGVKEVRASVITPCTNLKILALVKENNLDSVKE